MPCRLPPNYPEIRRREKQQHREKSRREPRADLLLLRHPSGQIQPRRPRGPKLGDNARCKRKCDARISMGSPLSRLRLVAAH
eukprot:3179064-Pyramimonas_sp.AAC.1